MTSILRDFRPGDLAGAMVSPASVELVAVCDDLLDADGQTINDNILNCKKCEDIDTPYPYSHLYTRSGV